MTNRIILQKNIIHTSIKITWAKPPSLTSRQYSPVFQQSQIKSYICENGKIHTRSLRYDCFICCGSSKINRPMIPMVRFKKSGFWKQTIDVHIVQSPNIKIVILAHLVLLRPIFTANMLNFMFSSCSLGVTFKYSLTFLLIRGSSK